MIGQRQNSAMANTGTNDQRSATTATIQTDDVWGSQVAELDRLQAQRDAALESADIALKVEAELALNKHQEAIVERLQRLWNLGRA